MSVSATAESRKPAVGTALAWRARIFLGLMITLAVLSFFDAAGRQDSWHVWRFALYLAMSVAASAMKVGLPGVRGNMSANVFFFMFSVVTLSSLETLTIGIFSAMAQTLWRPKSKPNWQNWSPELYLAT
jgi:hypothetical protein